MLKDFRPRLWKMLENWDTVYRKEVRANNYCPLYWAPVEDGASDKEMVNQTFTAEWALTIQAEFIQRYACFMALDGANTKNLLRIRRFLAYQCSSYAPRLNVCPAFTLTFWGGCHPGAVQVKVDELREFDFADSWSEVMYHDIHVSTAQWSTWTRTRIGTVIDHIVDDFEFDGYEAKVKLESGRPGQSAMHEIVLSCGVS